MCNIPRYISISKWVVIIIYCLGTSEQNAQAIKISFNIYICIPPPPLKSIVGEKRRGQSNNARRVQRSHTYLENCCCCKYSEWSNFFLSEINSSPHFLGSFFSAHTKKITSLTEADIWLTAMQIVTFLIEKNFCHTPRFLCIELYRADQSSSIVQSVFFLPEQS